MLQRGSTILVSIHLFPHSPSAPSYPPHPYPSPHLPSLSGPHEVFWTPRDHQRKEPTPSAANRSRSNLNVGENVVFVVIIYCCIYPVVVTSQISNGFIVFILDDGEYGDCTGLDFIISKDSFYYLYL